MSSYISCSIPNSLPTRYEFFEEILKAALPEVKDDTSHTRYEEACMKAAKELGVIDSSGSVLGQLDDEYIISEDSDAFALMYEINEVYKVVAEDKPNGHEIMFLRSTVAKDNLAKRNPKDQNNAVIEYRALPFLFARFCEKNSIEDWRPANYQYTPNEGNARGKGFKAAVVYTYLLLKRNACKETVFPFFVYCMERLGIKINSDLILSVLESFGFERSELETEHKDKPKNKSKNKDKDKNEEKDEKKSEAETECKAEGEEKKNVIESVRFHRLANRASILLSACVITLFQYVNKYDPEKDAAAIRAVHGMFENMLRPEVLAQDTVNTARRNLFSMLNVFDPRAIDRTDVRLQDVFVMPPFEKRRKPVPSPASAIANADSSERAIIVSSTGRGKSIYLQMLSLCSLKDEFHASIRASKAENAGSSEICRQLEASEARFNTICEQMGLPSDVFVIHIPAKMFTSLYSSSEQEHKEYTKDFVTLFFQAVCNLSNKHQYFAQGKESDITESNTLEAIGPEIYRYIRYLAKKGRLFLVLDSYDEITSGSARNAYVSAANKFYKSYCNINGKGAHVLLATREMSKDTMRLIKTALDIPKDSYILSELKHEHIKALISNWAPYKKNAGSVDADVASIESNHLRRELASTPYLLSVLYWNLDQSITRILERYVNGLKDRIIADIVSEDVELIGVLNDLHSKVLPSLALDSLKRNSEIIPAETIKKAAKELVAKKMAYIEESKIEATVERLFDTIVTEVGLIVPADGHDEAFQFIAQVIRYHLAARLVPANVTSPEKYMSFKKDYLDIMSAECFARLFVPLLSIDASSGSQLTVYDYAILASELAFRSYSKQCENEHIITAIVDILLANYAINYTTGIGGTDAGIVKRSQRMLLSRILTAKGSCICAEDKKKLIASNAWSSNSDFFSEHSAAALFAGDD